MSESIELPTAEQDISNFTIADLVNNVQLLMGDPSSVEGLEDFITPPEGRIITPEEKKQDEEETENIKQQLEQKEAQRDQRRQMIIIRLGQLTSELKLGNRNAIREAMELLHERETLGNELRIDSMISSPIEKRMKYGNTLNRNINLISNPEESAVLLMQLSKSIFKPAAAV